MELTYLWILLTLIILLNLISGGLLLLILLIIVFIGSHVISKICLTSKQSALIKTLVLPYYWSGNDSGVLNKQALETSLAAQKIIRFLKTREKDEVYYCFICQERRCFKHGPEVKVDLFPDRKILVNSKINQLLEENINLCLLDVESLRNNAKLCQEVKRCISFIIGNLVTRAKVNIEPSEFISKRCLTLLTQHLYLFLKGKRQAKSAYFIREQVIKVYREEGYYCDVNYLHSMVKSCHHLLLSPVLLSNSTLSLFSLELIINCVLEPFLDLISNPYYFNTFVILLLDGLQNVNNATNISNDKNDVNRQQSSSSSQDQGSGLPSSTLVSLEQMDQLLVNFSKPINNLMEEDNNLGLSLKEIVKDEQLLFIFMQYLKEEGAVNLIQFLLSVDSFNSRLLKPDLSEEEKIDLARELNLLFEEYFDEESPDYIHFKENSINLTLKQIINRGDVILLQTSDPLYKAYDQVYNIIDRVYLPLFVKSSYYFKLIAGSRTNHSLSFDAGDEDNVSLSSQISSLTESSRKVVTDEKQERDSIKETDEKAKEDLQVIHDLSSWQVNVDRVERRVKTDYDDDDSEEEEDRLVYAIKVSDDKDGSFWEVQREFDEFHVLQSKLRQFHGNIKGIDLQLPKKRVNLFSSSSSFPVTQTNISYLENNMNDLQNFLETLLANPALQFSSLLHSFLKPSSSLPNQFSSSSVDFKKMIRNLNSSFSLKGGTDLRTSLQPFIINFINSTENKRTNGNTDKDAAFHSCGDNSADYDDALDTMANELSDGSNCNEFTGDGKGNTIYELILFIMNSIYDLDETNSQAYYLLELLEPVVKDAIQLLTSWSLETKLKNLINLDNCILALENLKLSLEARRSPRDAHEEEKLRKLKESEALKAIQSKLNCIPFSSSSLSFHLYYCFQFPQLNKQFLYLLLNQFFLLLFPEVFS